MRGYIRKLSSKKGESWRIAVYLGKDNAGKKSYHWETFRGKKADADLRLNFLLGQKWQGQLVPSSKTTLAEYMDYWLEEVIKPHRSARTWENYAFLNRKYISPALGKVALSAIKSKAVEKLFNDLLNSGLSPSTVTMVRSNLNLAMKKAKKDNLIGTNPVLDTDPPQKINYEFRPMNEAEIKVVFERAMEGEYFPLFYTELCCGLRRNETIALRWSDINLDKETLSVNRNMQYLYTAPKGQKISYKAPKTKKSRRAIILTPSNVLILRQHLANQLKIKKILHLTPSDKDLVFCHDDGNPYAPHQITHAWIQLVRECGLEGVRLHDCRHTMATMMLAMNIHPKIVQERMGHSRISTTLDTYSHIIPGLQEASAKAFDEKLALDFGGFAISKKIKDCKRLQTPQNVDPSELT